MVLAEVPDDDLHAIGLVAVQRTRDAPNRLADTASDILQTLLAVVRTPALAESERRRSLADTAEDCPLLLAVLWQLRMLLLLWLLLWQLLLLLLWLLLWQLLVLLLWLCGSCSSCCWPCCC